MWATRFIYWHGVIRITLGELDRFVFSVIRITPRGHPSGGIKNGAIRITLNS